MTQRMTDHIVLVLYVFHSLCLWIEVLCHIAIAFSLVKVRTVNGLPSPACR